jgi:hypothetical protein
MLLTAQGSLPLLQTRKAPVGSSLAWPKEFGTTFQALAAQEETRQIAAERGWMKLDKDNLFCFYSG